MSTTITLDHQSAHAVGLVGNVVTWAHQQWTVHSVEGPSWYAFKDGETIKVDTGLTRIAIDPRVMIIPMGAKIGQGLGQELPVTAVRRGVCLVKSYR